MTSRAQKILIGLAIAFICGAFALGALAGVAMFGWKAAMRAGNETATIQNMKTIAVVEKYYFDAHDHSFGTIDQLVREQMLSSRFTGQPTFADGYVLTLKLTEKAGSYTLAADPRDDSSGQNHFYFDSASTQIHQNHDGPAGPSDPLL